MPKLALLDGHSLAYRAFYALPTDLATPSGQVTNAVYGFTSMVIKLLGDEQPTAMAVAWDTPAATFRSEEYPEYKAQRDAAPDLFRSQLPLIREVAAALNIPEFEAPGFEADDVIATITVRAASEGWEVLVVTGDRDAFQLIGGDVRVLYTRRGISDTITADAGYVNERYGIDPTQYVEFAALRGDPSDNLPGVPGVGEKTATKLLQAYGSLESLYEHLGEQTPRLRENLAAAREQVFLNRRLVRLVDDVPIEISLPELDRRPWDPGEVQELFEALAFRSLWPRLQEVGGSGEAVQYDVLDAETATELDVGKASALFGKAPTALAPVWHEGELVGVAVASAADEARYLPMETVLAIGDQLLDTEVPKAVHDAKPLMRALMDRGLALQGLVFDTALAAYVINPAERTPDLADLASSVLGLEVDSPDADVGPGDDQGTLDFEAEGPDIGAAGRQAVAVAKLVPELTERMEARGGRELYDEVELPLVGVLARMERVGIGVDREYLGEVGDSLRDRLATLEKDVYAEAGEPFNINSALQLREVLFERLGLPILKKTPKGAPSTDAAVLTKLAEEHPVVEHLLRYRELEKLRSTYVDGLMPLVSADGRIHAHFNQMGAATGRLSSDHPNLQNIPVRSPEGMTIRRAFVADPGHHFVVADYSQIELRILAHLSEDTGLIDAFAADEDIHTATAARVFGIDPTEVTPEQRRRAKVINFGLLYGMESYGLAQRLEISTEEAQEQMDAYFAQYPYVQAFMKGIVAEARESGYTTTILGRRRYLPELASGNFRQRQTGERMALNAPIQGSAADVIKKAMVQLDADLQMTANGTRMLLQIHDELVLEVPDDQMEEAQEHIRTVMEGIVPLRVPLRVDVATGRDLAECKA